MDRYDYKELREKALSADATQEYLAFLSRSYDSDDVEDEDFPDTVVLLAMDKEDAREKLAAKYAAFKVELSRTSEEVTIYKGGKEFVYYGFDVN